MASIRKKAASQPIQGNVWTSENPVRRETLVVGALYFLGHHNGHANSIYRYRDGFRALSGGYGESPYRDRCYKSGLVLFQRRKRTERLCLRSVFRRSISHDEAVSLRVVNISGDLKSPRKSTRWSMFSDAETPYLPSQP